MLLHNKRAFSKGFVLSILFGVVLWYMFTPSFGGENAFHASDALFNSISKGSTYYMPQVKEGARAFDGQQFEVVIFDKGGSVVPFATTVLARNGMTVSQAGSGLNVAGDLGALMTRAVADSDAMFHNKGEAVAARYDMDAKQVMYVWWQTMKEIKVALDRQKMFAPASFMDKNVIKRAIEVGYNYYGIEGQKATERWGIILFALVFYVVYTMWWGFAIFYMFEGLGLEMRAGKKREM